MYWYVVEINHIHYYRTILASSVEQRVELSHSLMFNLIFIMDIRAKLLVLKDLKIFMHDYAIPGMQLSKIFIGTL